MNPGNDDEDSNNSADSESEDETEVWFEEEEEVALQAEDDHSAECTDRNAVPEAVTFYVKFLMLWQSLYRLSDTGINILFAFFQRFLLMISRLLLLTPLTKFAIKLPKSLYEARKLVQTRNNDFITYATCQKCSAIYKIEECKIKLPNGRVASKECDHVEFPRHPQVHHRKKCGTMLMKNVRYSLGGSEYLHPKSIFCYRSIIYSLQNLLQRASFLEDCEKWKLSTSATSNGSYRDIYDGKIWKEFLEYDGFPFLSVPYNFGFILNIDWFQPYVHTQYSLGAIYLAVLNLPRSIRYLRENILLIGIIPGPKEPKKHVNTYLTPLVNDLKHLWNGVVMTNTKKELVIVKGALLCVACDLPAGRKVSGFVGPMALHGCSRCMIEFPTAVFSEKPDYSNFNKDDCVERKNSDTLKASFAHLQCNTKKDRAAIERDTGVRYSVLHELPYFNASRMTIIDPMHNLLLGTAKYLVNHWKDTGAIGTQQFEEIQSVVDSFTSPCEIGRIPYKIASGFSSFTADQWRNWIVLYSLVSLKSVLPFRQYRHWQLFVKACRLLCRHHINEEQVTEADRLLHSFCEAYVDLYGSQSCTPNLHLHGHLADCVRDFGPVYAFWLFSFERLNGVLGSYHTNNHSISVQVMRRFVDSQRYRCDSWPTEFKDEFYPLISKSFYADGSLSSSSFEDCVSSIECIQCVKAIPPVTEFVLDKDTKDDLLRDLQQYYSALSVDVRHICLKARALKLGSFALGSEQGKFKNSSSLLVKTPHEDKFQAVIVNYYIQCKIILSNQSSSELVWVAVVSKFESHPCYSWFGEPVQVWSRVIENNQQYIPISMIKSRVVSSELQIDFGRFMGEQTVLIVVPCD